MGGMVGKRLDLANLSSTVLCAELMLVNIDDALSLALSDSLRHRLDLYSQLGPLLHHVEL